MRHTIPPHPVAEEPAEAFVPAFCPNPRCHEHTRDRKPHQDSPRWFLRNGAYYTAAFGQVPRFRCTCCGRGFSRQTFRLDYYAKRVIDYRQVLHQIVSCTATRDLCRRHLCSTGTVANRVERLARQAAAVHTAALVGSKNSEALVIDGFQNFAVSKYFPNNINLLAGADSGFLYACNYRTIRRSGRMSERQKLRRQQLERLYRADKNAIRDGFRALLDAALRLPGQRAPIHIYSDCKTEYAQAIDTEPHYNRLKSVHALEHETILSTLPRTAGNRLFAVNYLDRQLRKDLKECVRHTVCFGRNVCNVMQRLLIYRMYHNHYKAFRHRDSVPTHAAVAGVDEPWIDRSLEGAFQWRAFLSRSALSDADQQVWLRRLVTPLKRKPEYLPNFALA